MNEVDYLKLSEQYVSFLVASAGVSITVLTLVLTFGSKSTIKSTIVDIRSFLIAALVISTISCFIGAQMMAETAASFSHFKDPANIKSKNLTLDENSPNAKPENPTFPSGRSPEDIPSRERLFLLASTNIFITVILLLFALLLLPTASEKVEPISISYISVSVFLLVVICAFLWMGFAVIYRIDVKGGLCTSVIVFIIGLFVGGVFSCLPKSKEQLLCATFIPIGFFSVAVLFRFAWIFSNIGKVSSSNTDYILDIFFFIFPITFSYLSLVVAGWKLIGESLEVRVLAATFLSYLRGLFRRA